jgi:hypothetical protein
MYSLDEDRLRSLISTLQASLEAGFASSSSPVDALFEVAVDVLLRLKTEMSEGALGSQANPEVIFQDWSKPDPLGNSRSIKIFESRKFYWDPNAAEEIQQMALRLVALKKRLSRRWIEDLPVRGRRSKELTRRIRRAKQRDANLHDGRFLRRPPNRTTAPRIHTPPTF